MLALFGFPALGFPPPAGGWSCARAFSLLAGLWRLGLLAPAGHPVRDAHRVPGASAGECNASLRKGTGTKPPARRWRKAQPRKFKQGACAGVTNGADATRLNHIRASTAPREPGASEKGARRPWNGTGTGPPSPPRPKGGPPAPYHMEAAKGATPTTHTMTLSTTCQGGRTQTSEASRLTAPLLPNCCVQIRHRQQRKNEERATQCTRRPPPRRAAATEAMPARQR